MVLYHCQTHFQAMAILVKKLEAQVASTLKTAISGLVNAHGSNFEVIEVE
jgi:hypothetical protein